MKAKIICIGQKMPSWVTEGCESYLKRISSPDKLSIEEVPLLKRSKNQDPSPQIDKEGKKMLAKIPKQSLVVALDLKGKSMSSPELATFIRQKSISHPSFCFLIGGPEGLSKECLTQSDYKWSLSDLTLAHPLARLMVSEALYRAWSILQGLPYHK
jgi:23S rRNA (pseudouridine1915-N3)-methyltransferase